MKIPFRVPRQFGAKKIGQEVKILVNGRKRDAVFIGSGRFSNAFWTDTDVFTYTWHGDLSKEILTKCAKHIHLPEIKWVDQQEIKGQDDLMRVYKMPYYPKLRTRKWDNEIKALGKALMDSVMLYDNQRYTHSVCNKINERVCRVLKKFLPDSLHEAISEVAYQAANYDRYIFDDFAKRNWGQDQKGNPVLLDALFSAQIVKDDIVMRDLETHIKEKYDTRNK